MAKQWTSDDVLAAARAYQEAAVLVAAGELDVFGILRDGPLDCAQVAAQAGGDERATGMLLDALAAMGLLTKNDQQYALADGLADLLTEGADRSVLAMVRHQGVCMRAWAQLAKVVKTGRRAEKTPSVRGSEADLEAFIEAMDVVSRPAAGPLIEAIGPLEFNHLLDLGGGPGTWTIAMLQAAPEATATLYDLPEVIPIARKHIAAAGMSERVTFVGGDFDTDETLPAGADLAWVGAIIHMNSREENRRLFAKVFDALDGGGRIYIRDLVMDDSHISPPAGALFAVNMLVNTPAGGTYSLAEVAQDLQAAGFADPTLLRHGEFMDSVIVASKPDPE